MQWNALAGQARGRREPAGCPKLWNRCRATPALAEHLEEVATVRHILYLLLAIPLALTACNSITGTQQKNPPALQVPIKNCIDDFRAVHILQPLESSEVRAGTRQVVTWEVEEFCSGWEARVEASTDGGRTWRQCEWTPNGCQHTWCVGDDCGGRVAMVRVTVRDQIGEVSDTHRYSIQPRRQHRVPHERD